MSTMRAARLHEVGAPMQIDEVQKPRATGADVVVEVRACGMVPNLANVLANWESWYPQMPLPPRPAIHGLDAVGIVHEVGEKVMSVNVGDRVYVNPGRSCGGCAMCMSGQPQKCDHWTLNGYFGYNENSLRVFERYPQGGFCQYMTAPANALVRIPDNIEFRQATRFGYLGTSYSALRKCGSLAGKKLVINGATGTLGVGATLFALAQGIGKIYAIARGKPLLDRLKALDPDRIEIFSNRDGSSREWIMAQTGGLGADFMLDTLGAVADLSSMKDAMGGLRRGGRLVNIGGTAGDLQVDVKWWMDEQIELIGSVWFTVAEGYEMAGMFATGAVDLGVLETQSWPLADINEGISGAANGNGGFTSYLIEID
ncbi:alcohol dehydrogenase catalytic domain-containing protein [Roseinatronobacter alkalisoli]|uniref:Alcohol dehydrogenase catalytic domain-containing protein n=1 Tax=Roseinatronobacter alkalisoli TaxID=3028235 RepID=A0ABT5TCI9_9RHOB|nr:alcohol dehydrogenase catalytic domain-containing protein [Roseinatronobacter sp. HJB301]MDD7972839.1 alcohol dehydrogenase catalytic domain-containing protein [Roseinatronobacter sp. HJB301]